MIAVPIAKTDDRARVAARLSAVLEGLVVLNELELELASLPELYASGVRYRRERGTELWQAAPIVLAQGFGDCEDLAAWRAAELRRAGVDATAIVVPTRRAYHAVVYVDGEMYEDPTRILLARQRQRQERTAT